MIADYEKEKPPKVAIDDVKDLPLIITNSRVSDKEAPVALINRLPGDVKSKVQSLSECYS